MKNRGGSKPKVLSPSNRLRKPPTDKEHVETLSSDQSDEDKSDGNSADTDHDDGDGSVSSVYDSDAYEYSGGDDDDVEDGGTEQSTDENDDDEFEDQGSSDDDDDRLDRQQQNNDEDSDGEDIAVRYEKTSRAWSSNVARKRSSDLKSIKSAEEVKATSNAADGENISVVVDEGHVARAASWVHTDDLSSDDDDDDGTSNRIGRVPLHWYDEYDHIGYDSFGSKVVKTLSANGDGPDGDALDRAIAQEDNRTSGKFVVYDALNDRNVELSRRQIELIRRVQAGAYAHPEHNDTPDYIDYFTGVDQQISGLSSAQYEPKARFQPSQWDKLQVERLLAKLEKGDITMDYLTGKVRDMGDIRRKKQANDDSPFMMWRGDEEDELANKKGPQHIAAPKQAPPGHAESYIPPDEYLPTDEELKDWADKPAKDKPYGHLVPRKFPNLRSVGAYEHSVREVFERCLDLYLCPRVMKRRLNINPESLVPKLPKASDLKPFPTSKCIEYITPYDDQVADATAPVIRAVTSSPDGQFMISGASDGVVRLWEVQTGRLMRSWNLDAIVSEFRQTLTSGTDGDTTEETNSSQPKLPVVRVEWNPNRMHHCLLATIDRFAVIIATGTDGADDAKMTAALLLAANQGGNVTSEKAQKAVKWISLRKKNGSHEKPVSAFATESGPICLLQMNKEVTSVRWQNKGDYFVTVAPKAGASAVLIHQLSKGSSQQPFSKAKGESQLACFHPNKPFLFVATQQHVRIYHLVKQAMVKNLVSGCRWIWSIDVHPSGDHLIVGTLDRRLIWFDLDLSSTPFKTLKYHERALRDARFHSRYPLMASASDDGAVHIFHSMVYSDLMRNPLIVPVKILRGHALAHKFGVLTLVFHPTQPWLFTGGADGKLFLWQDI